MPLGSITGILVSRFLLDLQEVNQNVEFGNLSATTPEPQSPTGTIAFARVVGSLGSMIAPPRSSSSSDSDLSSSPSWEGSGFGDGYMLHEMQNQG